MALIKFVMRNLMIAILIHLALEFSKCDDALFPTTVIVKIKEGELAYIQNEFSLYNFTLFRKITEQIYVFKTYSPDEFFDDDFNTDALLSKVQQKVEYLYKSIDLFHQSEVASGPVSGGSEPGVTKIPLHVGEDYKVCSPVYDPMFGIDDAWQREITGKGVVIAITDVGVDIHHPKLEPNIDTSLCWNFVDNNNNVSPEYYPKEHRLLPLTNHGNACAGLAAGIRNNSAMCQPCGCGTAPEASIAVLKVGIVPGDAKARMMPKAVIKQETLCASLAYRMNDIHIYSNSWNFNQSFQKDKCIFDVIEQGYTKGRSGKGNIFVFPADPPGNGFVSNIYTIAVGDMGVNGTLPDDPQVNSAVLVSMFARGTRRHDSELLVDIHVLDVQYLSPCSKEFRGQSATCAMASGVVAHLLQVNPDLTARDVKHILLESASNKGIAEESFFKQNAAGYKYHDVLGFGYPDSAKMNSLAKSWTTLPALRTEVFASRIQGNTAVAHVLSQRINKLEQIEIIVSITFVSNTNLSLEVTSPNNTTSVIFFNNTISTPLTNATPLMSNHFWGENPNGNWTIMVYSLLTLQTANVIFTSVQLQLHGTGTEFPSSTAGNILDDNIHIHANNTPRSNSIHSSAGGITAGVIVGMILLIAIIAAVCCRKRLGNINCRNIETGDDAENTGQTSPMIKNLESENL